MSTTTLLLVSIAAVSALLVLIIKAKLHPFIALMITALVLAVGTGVPLNEVAPMLIEGTGATLGSVALIVTLGAMLGRIVEVSGGAQVLANSLLARFGEKRAPWAVGAASFIFGIPVFADVAMIVFMPLLWAIGRRLGGNFLVFSVASGTSLMIVHAVLPPHPGIVGGSELMGAGVGMVLMLGFIPAIIMWLAAQFMLPLITRKLYSPVPGADEQEAAEENTDLPPMGLVLTAIFVPLFLIMGETVSSIVLPEDNPVAQVLALIGASPVALLIGVLLSIWLLGFRRGWSLSEAEDVIGSSLPPVAAVVVITGAGGMFAHVLQEVGGADAVATTLTRTGLPVFFLAWLMALLLRIAQGSATVATLAAAPLIAPMAAAADLTSLQVALVTVAIGVGATGGSHVNDSAFWVWSRYSGTSTSVALRSYTALTTAASVVGLGVVAIMWPLVALIS